MVSFNNSLVKRLSCKIITPQQITANLTSVVRHTNIYMDSIAHRLKRDGQEHIIAFSVLAQWVGPQRVSLPPDLT